MIPKLCDFLFYIKNQMCNESEWQLSLSSSKRQKAPYIMAPIKSAYHIVLSYDCEDLKYSTQVNWSSGIILLKCFFKAWMFHSSFFHWMKEARPHILGQGTEQKHIVSSTKHLEALDESEKNWKTSPTFWHTTNS